MWLWLWLWRRLWFGLGLWLALNWLVRRPSYGSRNSSGLRAASAELPRSICATVHSGLLIYDLWCRVVCVGDRVEPPDTRLLEPRGPCRHGNERGPAVRSDGCVQSLAKLASSGESQNAQKEGRENAGAHFVAHAGRLPSEKVVQLPRCESTTAPRCASVKYKGPRLFPSVCLLGRPGASPGSCAESSFSTSMVSRREQTPLDAERRGQG